MVYFLNPWAFKIIQNLFTDCVYQFNYSHAKPHPITLGGVPHDFTIFVLFLSEPMCWWPSTRFQKLSIPILTIAWYITLCSRITGPTSHRSASDCEQDDESPNHRQQALGGGSHNSAHGSTAHCIALGSRQADDSPKLDVWVLTTSTHSFWLQSIRCWRVINECSLAMIIKYNSYSCLMACWCEFYCYPRPLSPSHSSCLKSWY